ncbi:nitroreductase family protein [Halieaceae bacterium IMCC14734]|uniref:Nitroreductase family protein n=1 Tax=Candidatus Litorirhabdus singularis TaxID=2518993 RepID=A0ABT3TPX1_9GAMM|nr:nitroreductase family protein [Candidatus Litorirhabdus singularis]MCX2983444.1 nitroreductase family protein [Candidatus Litorirhabdus singularis]
MSQPMELHEAIYNCRAMRRLDNREVPEDQLIQLIDAANQAPSGSNAQNARWIVVRDAQVKQQLADLNRISVEAYVAPSLADPRMSDKRKRMMEAVLWQMDHLHEAPALIIACLTFFEEADALARARSAGSIWPGIQNLLLTARSLGLGAAPTTLALGDTAAVAKILNLPENMTAYALIPVGYPLGKFGPVSRKPLTKIMRFDRWSD